MDYSNTSSLNEVLIQQEIMGCDLNKCLNQELNVIYDEFKNCFKKCQDIVTDCDQVIDLHIEYMRDEIELRIESLKIELDNLNAHFNRKLDKLRMKLTSNYKKNVYKKFNENEIKLNFEQIETSISNSESLSVTTIESFNSKLENLKSLSEELRNDYPSVFVKVSKLSINEAIVGEIIHNYNENQYIHKQITNRINNGEYQTHDLPCRNRPFDICSLANNTLLVANRGLVIYDKTMNIIKTMTSLYDFHNIRCVAINEDNEIYFSDYFKDSILKTDSQFNKLAQFGNGVGTGDNQLDRPAGMCFCNGSLYVCDFGNKRIQKFDSNLTFEKSFQLDFSPFYIRNVKNTALVRPYGLPEIIFYSINNFNEIRRYTNHNSIIGVIHNKFYEYVLNEKIFVCYDENGEPIETLRANGLELTTNNFYGAICLFSSKLVLCKSDTSHLISI